MERVSVTSVELHDKLMKRMFVKLFNACLNTYTISFKCFEFVGKHKYRLGERRR